MEVLAQQIKENPEMLKIRSKPRPIKKSVPRKVGKKKIAQKLDPISSEVSEQSESADSSLSEDGSSNGPVKKKGVSRRRFV
jgi:hypothetical protein